MSAFDERLLKTMPSHGLGDGAAAASFRAILEREPDNVNALHLLGLVHLNAGSLAEADAMLTRALALRPEAVEILNNRGLCRLWQGRGREARDDLMEAIRLQPVNAEAFNNLGMAARNLGEAADEEAAFLRAIRIKPDFPAAFFNLATTVLRQGRAAHAEACCRRAIALQPQYPEAETALGLALEQQGKLEEAEACLRRSAAARANPQTLTGLGRLLRRTGRAAEAEQCLRASVELAPQLHDTLQELVLAFLDLGKLPEAEAAARKALSLGPDSSENHRHIGIVFRELGRYKHAEGSFRRALELNRDNAHAHCDLATLHLLSGRWKTGWKGYEWRWRGRNAPRQSFEQPPWDGSALEGKTILLWCDSSLEDIFQFVRYVRLVKDRGGRVILRGPACLSWLLRSEFLGAERVCFDDQPLPAFDTHAPIGSLPRILRTSPDDVPAEVPFVPHLELDAATWMFWQERLDRIPGLLVGILGRNAISASLVRSAPPENFAPLVAIPGVSLINLERGGLSARYPAGVWNLGSPYDDGNWTDVAAVVSGLDLVIAVDSPIVHLAGKLGIPTWLALPFTPDWRWLLDRDDSPWYSTVRLFRQPSPGDWKAVFEKLERELDEWARARSAGAGAKRRRARNDLEFIGAIALDRV